MFRVKIYVVVSAHDFMNFMFSCYNIGLKMIFKKKKKVHFIWEIFYQNKKKKFLSSLRKSYRQN